MTDQEIIRRVAVEVMGWEFILSSPNNEQPNDYDIYIQKRNNKGEVEKVIYCYEWRPLTNANHTMMLVERIAEKYDIELSWYKWKDLAALKAVEAA